MVPKIQGEDGEFRWVIMKEGYFVGERNRVKGNRMNERNSMNGRELVKGRSFVNERYSMEKRRHREEKRCVKERYLMG